MYARRSSGRDGEGAVRAVERTRSRPSKVPVTIPRTPALPTLLRIPARGVADAVTRRTVAGARGRPRENRLLQSFRAVEEFPALRESRDAVVAGLDAGVPDEGAIVAGVVSDLGLAIRVLREAVRVAGTEPVGSVAVAVDRLEPGALRTICATVPTYDVLGPPGHWHDAPYRYLRHAVAVQRGVRRLSGALSRPDREVLVTAALLHDVGKLALAHADGRPGEPFAGRRASQARDPSGVDDAAIGGILLRRWGLPRGVWRPVEHHGTADPDRCIAILRLADLAARHDRGDGVTRAALLQAAETAGVDEDVLRALLYDQADIVVVPRGVAPCPLTPAELEALRGLSRGLRYKEIAQELGVQPTTIGSHLHKVYVKTGTTDRAQAVLLAAERGWLEG
jgi:DNA-binding CsgD family transcriptional regulator/HD-like signal output (HDOD) protein